jgi:hypothetical protein
VEDAGDTDAMTRVAVSIPAARPYVVSTNGKEMMVPEVGAGGVAFGRCFRVCLHGHLMMLRRGLLAGEVRPPNAFRLLGGTRALRHN